MNKGTKIKDFIAALEMGETREKARDIAGCSDATSKIQFAKWKASKGESKPKAVKKSEGKAIPKDKDKKKKVEEEDLFEDDEDDVEVEDEL